MKLIELLEAIDDEKVNKVIQFIQKKYSEEEMAEKFDEEVMNWVDDTWEDEFDNEFDWYAEYGKGEAEEVVMTNVKTEAKNALKIKLTWGEDDKIDKLLKDHYYFL